MNLLDLTFPTPAENLACDEALLDLCEEEGVEVLRFWESREPFVVVGYANQVASEVNIEECHERGVPILRRCSGGGTVVQGPGCLNYNLTLRIPENGPLTTVTGTNEFVMERHRGALEKLLAGPVAVKGHTDLAFETSTPRAVPCPPATDRAITEHRGENATPGPTWLKFSGNAQRRRRKALVFHGTILHGFDLSIIDALLCFPSKQPDYRDGRTHHDFVSNINREAGAVKKALREAWQAKEPCFEVPAERVQRLVAERYSRDEWNFSR